MNTSTHWLRLAILGLGAAGLACSDSGQPFVPPDPDSFVVQAYVFAGEPIDQVYVTGVLPIDAEEGDVAPPIRDAAITILRGPDRFDLVPMPGEPGRYHFEGVTPGTHVVQLDLESLPPGYEVVVCDPNNRFAGRPFAQFVDLQGGTVWRAEEPEA